MRQFKFFDVPKCKFVFWIIRFLNNFKLATAFVHLNSFWKPSTNCIILTKKKVDFSTSANFVLQQIYKLHLLSPRLFWEAEVFFILVFFKNVSLQKSCVTICNDFCIPCCTWWLFSLQLDIFMNIFCKEKKRNEQEMLQKKLLLLLRNEQFLVIC